MNDRQSGTPGPVRRVGLIDQVAARYLDDLELQQAQPTLFDLLDDEAA